MQRFSVPFGKFRCIRATIRPFARRRGSAHGQRTFTFALRLLPSPAKRRLLLAHGAMEVPRRGSSSRFEVARRSCRAVSSLVVLGLLAGCSLGAVGKGNRLFARGDLLGAAAAYETSLAKGAGDPELLFRLAVIYLSAEPLQLEKGEGLLRRLVAEDVGGPYRPAAGLLLSSGRRLSESKLVADTLRTEIAGLESKLVEQSARIAGLQGAGASRGEAIGELQRARGQLESRVAALQSRLATETERVRSLETELQKLKAIDLGRPPGR